MAKFFSIKWLMVLSAIVAVVLTVYMFNPDAVEKRRLTRDTYKAWEINRKIGLFETSSDDNHQIKASSLLDDGIINDSDFEFLLKHSARIIPLDERTSEIPVRMELLIKNYRTLCFSDGSVSIFIENSDGYEAMPLVEFWKIREFRKPRLY